MSIFFLQRTPTIDSFLIFRRALTAPFLIAWLFAAFTW